MQDQLGFEHGDVRRPYVLGALFNGKDTPGADLVKAASSLAARFPRTLDVATKQQALLAADEGVTVQAPKGPIEVSSGKAMKLVASAGGRTSRCGRPCRHGRLPARRRPGRNQFIPPR